MKGASALGLVAAFASTASAISAVYASGNAFWVDNARFYIRGVDYQPGGSSDPVDPIADVTTCKRDIPYFKKLGLNTIRVYTVDNTANHDECMKMLADAGIYLALDVNNGLYSLNRDDPAPSYNNIYLRNVFATIDAFSGYNNTLLFFSGNEVINDPTNTNTAPYIKAVTRDMKNYIKAQSPRMIPVGYSAADVAQNRFQTAMYMNCGPDGMARSDFFAFNDYSWCDPSSFHTSGWQKEVKEYGSYSIPLFLSEYGCNKNPPREFQEVPTLYSSKMSPVYSGGLVYEYTEESDNPDFGLVNVVSPTKVTERTDYKNLMAMLKKAPSPGGDGGYLANGKPSQCPPYSKMWEVHGDGLPAIPVPAEKYIKDGAPPGFGLTGPGSQHAGVQSTGTVTAHDPGVSQTGPPAHISSAPSGGSGSGSGAGSHLRPAQGQLAPLVFGAVVAVSAFLGAALL